LNVLLRLTLIFAVMLQALAVRGLPCAGSAGGCVQVAPAANEAAAPACCCGESCAMSEQGGSREMTCCETPARSDQPAAPAAPSNEQQQQLRGILDVALAAQAGVSLPAHAPSGCAAARDVAALAGNSARPIHLLQCVWLV